MWLSRFAGRDVAAPVWFAVFANLCCCTGCSEYPEPLVSAAAIKRTPATTAMIAIADLPLTDYPYLAKFRNLTTVQFYKEHSEGATDAKLKALASIDFPALKGIDLLRCSAVTDAGIRDLARFRTLEWLQLEGTSVTDASLDVLSSMHLRGLNVAFTRITLNGLKKLAVAGGLRELTFSANGEATVQACEVLEACNQVKHFEVVDKSNRLDREALGRCASKVGAQLVVRNKGALEQ